MKNKYATSVTAIIRNAFFVTAFSFLTIISAHAQTVAQPASLSYLGTANDQMAFVLKYANESGEKYAVTIKDKEGIVLFDGTYTDKVFSKTFKIPTDMEDLIFVISNAKNRAEKKFQVSTERRVVEEVYVTKAK
jgi:outer membrane phospholipase A